MRTIGVSMFEYLPEGMEVIFYIEGDETSRIGVVTKYSSLFLTEKGDPPLLPNDCKGVVYAKDGNSHWHSAPGIRIIKLNPTPKQKMYYMLKGAECSSG